MNQHSHYIGRSPFTSDPIYQIPGLITIGYDEGNELVLPEDFKIQPLFPHGLRVCCRDKKEPNLEHFVFVPTGDHWTSCGKDKEQCRRLYRNEIEAAVITLQRHMENLQ